MSEALEAGTLRIEEVDEEGSVPELMAHNAGDRNQVCGVPLRHTVVVPERPRPSVPEELAALQLTAG